MGRLTLNVLLSFAQFEREVTGERIRDKIAASRRKGISDGWSSTAGLRLAESGAWSLTRLKRKWSGRSFGAIWSWLGAAAQGGARPARVISKSRSSTDGVRQGYSFSRGALYVVPLKSALCR